MMRKLKTKVYGSTLTFMLRFRSWFGSSNISNSHPWPFVNGLTVIVDLVSSTETAYIFTPVFSFHSSYTSLKTDNSRIGGLQQVFQNTITNGFPSLVIFDELNEFPLSSCRVTEGMVLPTGVPDSCACTNAEIQSRTKMKMDLI